MTYIENLKKPRNMEVCAFSEWLGLMISQAKRIPPIDDDITITDTKRKMIVYEGMPYSWRSKFQLAGKKLNEKSLQELVQPIHGKCQDQTR
jgi:hypothetical protein